MMRTPFGRITIRQDAGGAKLDSVSPAAQRCGTPNHVERLSRQNNN